MNPGYTLNQSYVYSFEKLNPKEIHRKKIFMDQSPKISSSNMFQALIKRKEGRDGKFIYITNRSLEKTFVIKVIYLFLEFFFQ